MTHAEDLDGENRPLDSKERIEFGTSLVSGFLVGREVYSRVNEHLPRPVSFMAGVVTGGVTSIATTLAMEVSSPLIAKYSEPLLQSAHQFKVEL